MVAWWRMLWFCGISPGFPTFSHWMRHDPKQKKQRFKELLIEPGPDMIIADEGMFQAPFHFFVFQKSMRVSSLCPQSGPCGMPATLSLAHCASRGDLEASPRTPYG